MVDTVKMVLLFGDLSNSDYEQCSFPFQLGQKTDESGEIRARYYDWEPILSPLTGAKCQVRAISADANSPGRIAGYELDVNIPACIIGRNHELVNGVPRAVEGAVALLRHFAAKRGCSLFGLEQFRLDSVRLGSITPTFLFEFDTPKHAMDHLIALRDYGEGVLNYISRSLGLKDKKRKPSCYSVGPDICFTVYIRLREFTVVVYIKQPNIQGAFVTFPNQEVEDELVERAKRTVRVEVQVHGKWLKDNNLDTTEGWRDNPSAYAAVFNLVRDALRLDEDLRVRAPAEAIIAKLPADYQTVLRAHLAGDNIREHVLILSGSTGGDQVIGMQNKKFSAFKRLILETTAIDISIPWKIQSTKLSPHLRDWLQYPGEFKPSDSVAEYVFSRTSVPNALAELTARTDTLLVVKRGEWPRGSASGG